MSERIKEIAATQERLTEVLPQRVRLEISRLLEQKSPRGRLLTGPRGVGKSTFALLAARKLGALYVSVDSPVIAQTDLWELGKAAIQEGYGAIVFDEVHMAKDWSAHLKALYDAYPTLTIWASDSSQVVLHQGMADLSRRFVRTTIPLLSFREFVHLKTGIELRAFDPFDPEALKSGCKEALAQVPVLTLFREHLEAGARPIFEEGFYAQRLLQTVEKTIYSDLPFLLPQMHENYLRVMSAMIGQLALAPVPTLNIDSLSRDWAIGKEKLYRLLTAMDQVQLLHVIRRASDRKTLSKGAKIFFRDPSLYGAIHFGPATVGTRREAYVASQLANAGRVPFAAKDDREFDLIAGGHRIEIGGKDKKRKKADFVVRDDIDRPPVSGREVPLWAVGMGY